jgi:hypothetical protein
VDSRSYCDPDSDIRPDLQDDLFDCIQTELQVTTQSPTAAGSIFNVLSVFPQQGIRVLSTYTVRIRDIVPLFLQTVDNLFHCIICCLHMISPKFRHYLIQAVQTDLSAIQKFQYAPANCRW